MSVLNEAERAVLAHLLDHGRVSSSQLEQRLRRQFSRHEIGEAWNSLWDQGILGSLGQIAGSTRRHRSSWLVISNREEVLALLGRVESSIPVKEGPRSRLSGLAAQRALRACV
jgi:hypothetical protein